MTPPPPATVLDEHRHSCWRASSSAALNLEIDGTAHLSVENAWADMKRDIAMLLTGDVTVRIPASIVHTEPAALAETIRQLLHAPWTRRTPWTCRCVCGL